MGFLLVVWLWAGILGIYYVMLRPGPEGRSILAIASMIESIVFSVAFIIGLEGLARRKKYGRWIAVCGLSLVFIAGMLNSFAAFGRYPGPAKSLAAFAVGVIVFGPVGFLVYRLARGERENTFFKQDKDKDLNAENAESAESRKKDF
jgi:hypothetical protein